MNSALANLSKSPAIGYAILGVVGIVAFVVVRNAITSLASAAGDVASKAVNAAGAAGTAVIDSAGAFATGNTQTAHGTPYEGAGVLGSLGADTDALFGGGLSTFGGWLGNKIYDVTHAGGGPGDGGSLNISNYGANNNAYGGGTSTLYSGAVDSSPTPASAGFNSLVGTAATPNTNTVAQTDTWE